MNSELNELEPISHQWVVVDEVAGALQAEIIRGFLTSQGLTVRIAMEGVGRVHGFVVGPLGTNQVLVPDGQVEYARKVLQAYYDNDFDLTETEADDLTPEEPGENDG
jgi:hypothetical protein